VKSEFLYRKAILIIAQQSNCIWMGWELITHIIITFGLWRQGHMGGVIEWRASSAYHIFPT
jgi:hypothetical protein